MEQKASKEITVKCPQCGARTGWQGNVFRPFCSERCKLIDLGRWAEGEYYIPGKPAPDQEEGQDEES